MHGEGCSAILRNFEPTHRAALTCVAVACCARRSACAAPLPGRRRRRPRPRARTARVRTRRPRRCRDADAPPRARRGRAAPRGAEGKRRTVGGRAQAPARRGRDHAPRLPAAAPPTRTPSARRSAQRRAAERDARRARPSTGIARARPADRRRGWRPLWLTLERNLEWWTTGPLLGLRPAGRVRGLRARVAVLPRPGPAAPDARQLRQAQRARGARATTPRWPGLLDELLPLAAERAGGLAWEYYFTFGGGAAAVGERPRPGHRRCRRWRARPRGCGAAGRRAAGRRARAGGLRARRRPRACACRPRGGAHYLLYSFAPGLRVLNGFIQSLVGLYDYAALAGDPRARALFAAGEREARAEVPAFDTGAWSLYSRGSVTRESDLGYHDLLRDFLDGLCDRTAATAVYCDGRDALHDATSSSRR